MLLTEEENPTDTGNVEVTFSPFVLLSDDEDVIIPPDWIVCVVNPLEVCCKSV